MSLTTTERSMKEARFLSPGLDYESIELPLVFSISTGLIHLPPTQETVTLLTAERQTRYVDHDDSRGTLLQWWCKSKDERWYYSPHNYVHTSYPAKSILFSWLNNSCSASLVQVWSKLGIKKEEVIQWVENCRKVHTLCTRILQLGSRKMLFCVRIRASQHRPSCLLRETEWNDSNQLDHMYVCMSTILRLYTSGLSYRCGPFCKLS